MSINKRMSRGVIIAMIAGCASLGLVAPAHAFENRHTLFQGEPSPIGQTNGPVAATEIAGGRIYVGGNFDSIRPSGAAAGSSESPVHNLAAFDATTGAPIPSFHPNLYNAWSNSTGYVSSMAVSPDGKTLYVGGNFNTVDGITAEHIAAFDTTTGAFKGQVGWNGANGDVKALAVSPDAKTLYVGGAFNQVSWQARGDIAAVDLVGGGPKPFAPALSTTVGSYPVSVLGLGVSADGTKVYAAGPFRTANGASMQGFAAFNSTSGANVAGFKGSYLYAPYSFGTSIDVNGNTVYVGGRDDITSTGARTEGVFSIDATTGAQNWYNNCYGDTFAVLAVGTDVYAGSHSHDCSATGGMPEGTSRNYLAIHAIDKTNGQEVPYFVQTEGTSSRPDTLLTSRALASDGSQLVMGGGYLSVNGKAQANLTRFKLGSSAPGRAPWAQATASGTNSNVSVKVLKSFDRDDVLLTYKVYRGWDTSKAPVATYTQPSLPWPDTSFTITDGGATPGSSVYYKVVVSDPAGNTVSSVNSNTVRVGGGTAAKTQAKTTTQPAPSGTTTSTTKPTDPPATSGTDVQPPATKAPAPATTVQ